VATVPGCDQAIVESAKVVSYLLSSTHPIGRSKARFFTQFGFREDAPEKLVQALLKHIRTYDVAVAHLPVPNATVLRRIGRDRRDRAEFTPFPVPDRRDWEPAVTTLCKRSYIARGQRRPR